MNKILSFLKSCLVCGVNYFQDLSRYIAYSQVGMKRLNTQQLSAKMLASAHVIEKGMSLPSPRLGYGQSMLKSLMRFIRTYTERGYDKKEFPYTNSIGVLRAYEDFHVERDYDLGEIGQEIHSLILNQDGHAGYNTYPLSEYLKSAKGDFRECALSRYSVRSFSGEAISESKVREALDIARKTPSVCNRQSWKAYWVKSPEAKKNLAELQNGHRGFGDQVDSFLVITTDLHSFFDVGERNQCFVDGGLYAMSLMYALHYAGVGACPLNWCMPASKDRKLREEIKISASENIILVLALGSLPEEIRVAKSIRKSVDDTLLIR